MLQKSQHFGKAYGFQCCQSPKKLAKTWIFQCCQTIAVLCVFLSKTLIFQCCTKSKTSQVWMNVRAKRGFSKFAPNIAVLCAFLCKTCCFFVFRFPYFAQSPNIRWFRFIFEENKHCLDFSTLPKYEFCLMDLGLARKAGISQIC